MPAPMDASKLPLGSFFFNPLADICGAILESGAIPFATSQESYCVQIHELDIFQIQNDVVVVLSFGFEESLQLIHLFQAEGQDNHIILDLKDVKLVDLDAVRFLTHCEGNGAQLENCPAYIREWIEKERPQR